MIMSQWTQFNQRCSCPLFTACTITVDLNIRYMLVAIFILTKYVMRSVCNPFIKLSYADSLSMRCFSLPFKNNKHLFTCACVCLNWTQICIVPHCESIFLVLFKCSMSAHCIFYTERNVVSCICHKQFAPFHMWDPHRIWMIASRLSVFWGRRAMHLLSS